MPAVAHHRPARGGRGAAARGPDLRDRTRRAARLDGADLQLAEDLGRRAAIAVDNARCTPSARTSRGRCRRACCRRRCPSSPALELAARFRAAGAAHEVGGDFYDLFAAPDGRWALVIGDVCGKGAEAAAVTALARYTIRAAGDARAAARRGCCAS